MKGANELAPSGGKPFLCPSVVRVSLQAQNPTTLTPLEYPSVPTCQTNKDYTAHMTHAFGWSACANTLPRCSTQIQHPQSLSSSAFVSAGSLSQPRNFVTPTLCWHLSMDEFMANFLMNSKPPGDQVLSLIAKHSVSPMRQYYGWLRRRSQSFIALGLRGLQLSLCVPLLHLA